MPLLSVIDLLTYRYLGDGGNAVVIMPSGLGCLAVRVGR